MGQNKALMPFRDRPLIERVVNRLKWTTDELFVVSNQPELFDLLKIPVYPDLVQGIGALGGLYTGLYHARQPFVAIIACDMPFASPKLVFAQRDMMIAENVDVVIPETADGLEPFHALYRRDACLPHIEKAIGDGKRRMIGWFSDVRVRKMSALEITSIPGAELAFINVNTPEEYRRAENLETE